jgi:para-nitrobenzyl esterase
MLRSVQVENGSMRGLPAADPRITSFKGIPYAAPPVEGNRWRAPQPAADWDGVLQAFEFAPIAMQATPGLDPNDIYTREWHVDSKAAMSEDCLYLNVWTPATSGGEKLPVFVWYFGGGLQVGYPSEMEFDGERIARRGVVVVTVGYRLNVFGFLCHPELTAQDPSAPANFGNLDQQFATRWVQRNIAAFGGDPGNITIGGQSAGGGSVVNQLVSPQNKDLFQRAFVDSGFLRFLYQGQMMPHIGVPLAKQEQQGVDFLKALGVSSITEARRLDARLILDRSLALGYTFLGTVIDGQFCVGNAFDLILTNKRWMVPLLLGNTSSEYYTVPEAKTAAEFVAMAQSLFGEDAPEFLALCDFAAGDLAASIRKASVITIEYAIRLVGQANNTTGANAPLYYFVFDPEIPGWDNPGTFHSCDLWFWFETLAKCWRPYIGKHYELARQMCDYLANFCRSGDPNGVGSDGQSLPTWQTYSAEEPHGMVFDDESHFGPTEPSPMMQFLVRSFFKNRPSQS